MVKCGKFGAQNLNFYGLTANFDVVGDVKNIKKISNYVKIYERFKKPLAILHTSFKVRS